MLRRILIIAAVLCFGGLSLASFPFVTTVSVTTAATGVGAITNAFPRGSETLSMASWCIITNRSTSADSFDISYNSGLAYGTRLPIGASITIGSASTSSVSIDLTTMYFRCVSSTSTAEVTCGQ